MQFIRAFIKIWVIVAFYFLEVQASQNDQNSGKKSNKLEIFCKGYADDFSSLKHLPQYKYISRPIYRAMGGSNLPLISVPASFIATDLIMHRGLAVMPLLLFKDDRSRIVNNPKQYLKEIIYNPLGNVLSVFWAVLSIPVAYHKHLELKKKKLPSKL